MSETQSGSSLRIVPVSSLRIVPVLDVLAGTVVRGIGGQRQHYRPIQSRWTHSTEPLAVAQMLHDRTGASAMYLADLDAIQGAPPNLALYDRLAQIDVDWWIDAGVRQASEVQLWGNSPRRHIVVGSETLHRAEELTQVLAECGSQRVLFSLDLYQGRTLGSADGWPSLDAFSLVAEVVRRGIQRLMVLDLYQVGRGQGTGTEALCRRIREAFPQLELVTGGGIRQRQDLFLLAELGVNAVLVASALHDSEENWQVETARIRG